MVNMADTHCMGSLIIIAFVVLAGPAALLWGADSRSRCDKPLNRTNR